MTLNKQFYQVYDFAAVADIEAPEGGQIVVVTKTPDFGAANIQLTTNGKHTIRELYESWKNGEASPFRTSTAQDTIDRELQENIDAEAETRAADIAAEATARTNAINSEAQARTQGDANTLAAAKDYTDEAQLATQTWVRAVNLKSDLDLITGLNNKVNYLCRVIADPVQSNNGVYQAIAGWSGSPVWTYFSDNQDWIDPLEMADAIAEHNQNQSAGTHADIRAAVVAEANERAVAVLSLQNNISSEVDDREQADNDLQEQIDALSPEGQEGLPVRLANIEAALLTKAPKNHTSSTGEFGVADDLFYGHVRFPQIGAVHNHSVAAFPYYYLGESMIVDLNDYNFRKAGIYVFADPAVGSVGFPVGWGTGQSNAAVLEVLPFYSTVYVRQILRKMGSNLTYERYSTSPTEWSSDGKDWELVSGHLIGDLYIQWPNTKTPAELGYDGFWEKWHYRVERYGLSTSLPSGYNTLIYETSPSGNAAVASGNYRTIVYADGDREVMMAKVAIAAGAAFNPVEWEPLSINTNASYRPTYVWRTAVQPTNWASDLAIGATVTYNGQTRYIVARHNLGGKFLSMTGGNRPTYDSDGIGRDAQRPIKGSIVGDQHGSIRSHIAGSTAYADGAFAVTNLSRGIPGENIASGANVDFDSSRVVPTDAAENKVRTMAAQPWRKTS